MKTKTIQLIIKTDLENTEVIDIMNNGCGNLKELGMDLLSIDIVKTANSLIKGIDYNSP